MDNSDSSWIETLKAGAVIPAHPLALTSERRLDERHQRALARYYCAAGADGIAVGVHSTQFEIRLPQYDLYRPVLELAAETLSASGMIMVAGVCGNTAQAVSEAAIARDLGYNAALLSLAALSECFRRRIARSCQSCWRGNSRHRFLSSTGSGWKNLSLRFLATFCRD